MIPTSAARGLGRLAYRRGQELHLALTDAERDYPGASREDVRRGWYAERAESITEPGEIGGGR